MVRGHAINASVFLTLVAIPLAWLSWSARSSAFSSSHRPRAGRGALCRLPEKRMVWLALLISGAAAGLAGVSEVGARSTIERSLGAAVRLYCDQLLRRSADARIRYRARFAADGAAVSSAARRCKSRCSFQAISQVFQGCSSCFLLGCDVLVNYRIEARSRVQGTGSMIESITPLPRSASRWRCLSSSRRSRIWWSSAPACSTSA